MEQLGDTNIFSNNMRIFENINTSKCYVGLHNLQYPVTILTSGLA